MSKMMKKLLVVVLSIVSVLSVFTACSGMSVEPEVKLPTEISCENSTFTVGVGTISIQAKILPAEADQGYRVSLVSPVDGVTLNGKDVTISETAIDGSQFTVEIASTDVPNVKTQATFTVYNPVPEVTLVEWTEGNGVTFDKNDVTFETPDSLSVFPKTYETWLQLDESVTTQSVLFGNYTGLSLQPDYLRITINGEGHPSFNGNTFNSVDVRSSEFVHLAITVDTDDDKIKCYLNGELKGTLETSVSTGLCDLQSVIGGEMMSGNAHCFPGKIKSFAMFKDVRSLIEINEDMDAIETADEDLIGAYDFNTYSVGDNKVEDLSKNNYDVVVNQVWLDEIDHVQDYAYSFAVVGDTQTLLHYNPDKLDCIYDYIVDNKDEKNIKYVIGLGDIVELRYQSEGNLAREWEIAKKSVSKLDGQVPYALTIGNHDETRFFNKTFGTDEYLSGVGGVYNGNIANSWRKIQIGDYKYLLITLEWLGESSLSNEYIDDLFAWAGEIIEQNSDCRVILSTHSCIHYNAGYLEKGEYMWNNLTSKYENIVMVLSGHVQWDFIEVRESTGVHGNKVVEMLIDPQDVDANGPTGLVAMFYFNEDGSEVSVEYYSTVRNQYFKAANQLSFTLDTRVNNKATSDTEKPSITVVNAPVGVKGQQYTIPEIRVSDNSGETIVPEYKVYLTSDDTKTPISVTDGKFTPTESGSYTIEVTAKDSSDNTQVVTKLIAIRETALGETELEDFSNKAVTDYVYKGDAEYEYLDTYMGKQGVLHLKPHDTKITRYAFKLLNDINDLPYKINSITISCWVNAGQNDQGGYLSTDLRDAMMDAGKYHGLANSTPKDEDGWYEVTFTEFYDWEYWVDCASSSTGVYAFWTWTENTHIYIDKIYFDAHVSPIIEYEDEKYAQDDEITINAYIDGENKLKPIISVLDSDGQSVTVSNGKFTATKAGIYTITASVTEPSIYSGESSIELKVWGDHIELPTYQERVAIGGQVTLLEASFVDAKTGLAIDGSTVTAKVTVNGHDVTVTDNKFTATEEGAYIITYTAKSGDVVKDENHVVVYVSDKTAVGAPSETFVSATGTKEYVEEYQGAYGVIKVTNIGTYPILCLGLINVDAEWIEGDNWDYFEYRINHTRTEWAFEYASGHYPADTWRTFRIDRSEISSISSFAEQITGSGYPVLQLYGEEGFGTMYIDYVTFGSYRKVAASGKTLGFDNEKDAAKSKTSNAEWLESYESASGVVKFNNPTDVTWGGFKFDIMSSAEYGALDLKSLTFRIFVAGTSQEGHEGKFQIMSPGYGAWFDANKWIEVTFPVTNYDLSNVMSGESRLFGITNFTTTAVYVDYVNVDVYGSVEDSGKTLGFDSERNTANFKNTSATTEWLDSYDGASGVLKVSGVAAMQFDLGLTQSEFDLLDWDYVEIRAKITGTRTGANKPQLYYAGNWRERYDDNLWVIIKLNKSTFTTEYPEAVSLYSYFNNATMFELVDLTSSSIVFYIDYINFGRYGKVADSGKTLGFDSEKDATKSTNATTEWLESFEGASGVVKATSSDYAWTGIRFNLISAEDYAKLDVKNIEVRVYVAAGASTWQVIWPNTSSYWGTGGLKTNEWMTLTIPTDKIDTAALTGGFRLFGVYDCSDISAVYVDYVNINVYGSVEASGKTLGFDSERNTANFKNTSATTEWLDSYDGASGVLKVSGVAAMQFDLGLTQSEFDLLDWNYVEIRAKITGTRTGTSKPQLYYAGDWHERYDDNLWVIIKLNKSTFTTKYPEAVSLYSYFNNATMFELVDLTSSSIVFYIDYIDFVKSGSVAASGKTLGFDNETDIAKSKNSDSEWISEFQGVKGVDKVTCGSSSSNGYKFDLGMSKEDFLQLDWDYLEIRFWLDDVYYDNDHTAILIALGERLNLPKQVKEQCWTTFRFYSKAFVLQHKTLEEFYDYINGTNALFILEYAGTKYIYVDYLDFRTYGEDEPMIDFGSSGDDTYCSTSNSTWLASYTDTAGVTADGVVKVSYDGQTSWPSFVFKAVVSYESDANTWTQLKLRVLVEADGEQTPEFYYNDGNHGRFELGKWVEVTLDATAMANYAKGKLSAGDNIMSFANVKPTAIYIDYIDLTAAKTE